ncbi:hypothetical protein [Gayadomonas joobiniege]|uniref:hypothetical protein n=1 Tax=Gayadomonas joobiniege TaxID=1234606 RepID=UPI000361FAB4|nr:hypothetical protein [Gayadomonas joobiniege]
MKAKLISLTSAITGIFLLAGFGETDNQQTELVKELNEALSLQTYQRANLMYNEAAYIPAQCYTKTKNEKGGASNPCYVCHGAGKRPNFFNGTDLQMEYGFTAKYGETNRWKNLFRDFSGQIAQISDREMQDYVKQSNYLNADGSIKLAQRLKDLPSEWDANNNGRWDGFMPDVYFNFDELGFDRDLNNKYTGWRVFAYAPFPGAFFPTNGSTDDVLIRLPELYQTDANGIFDKTVYQINLAVVEAMIKEQDIEIPKVDEKKYQVDLDKDGKIATAAKISYRWAPLKKQMMSYVGQAKTAFEQGKINMAAGLYPVNTEFLHTVRYLDRNADGQMMMSARIKEVRYSKKTAWNNYMQLQNYALSEIKEKHDFPERLRVFEGNSERGLYNGMGWKLQGFIEDKKGELRPQTFEETAFCIGCHSGTSATTDASYAMPRKYTNQHFKNGWYHWSEKGFKGAPELTYPDGRYEYTTYLQNNPWGDEFRSNEQVYKKFYQADGKANTAMFNHLKNDISVLMEPDPERANLLNKAYLSIVREQSYIWGRQPMLAPAKNVYKFVESGTPTDAKVIMR